jgi:hypothetical protein
MTIYAHNPTVITDTAWQTRNATWRPEPNQTLSPFILASLIHYKMQKEADSVPTVRLVQR